MTVAASSALAVELARPRPPTWDVASVAPGLYEGVSEGDYHRRVLGVASKHALDYVLEAPAKYRAWVKGAQVEDEEKDAFRLGHAFECALLEPERFERSWAIAPPFGDCRLKGPKVKRDAWREANAGRLWLDADDGAMVRGMVASCLENERISQIVYARGVVQPTLAWNDPETGLRAKARLDLLLPNFGRAVDVVVDIKTCRSAKEARWAWQALDLGYDRQAAHYLDGLRQIGRRPGGFAFVCVEKTPPYLCAAYELDEEDLDKGAEAIGRAMRTLADCVANDTWPGLPGGIQKIKLPRRRAA